LFFLPWKILEGHFLLRLLLPHHPVTIVSCRNRSSLPSSSSRGDFSWISLRLLRQKQGMSISPPPRPRRLPGLYRSAFVYVSSTRTKPRLRGGVR
jgi:hypothetical protein